MQIRLLKTLLSQPTAPYREAQVRRTLEGMLQRGQVPFFKDPIGNLVVGVASRKEYLQRLRAASAEPLRMLIAHMDHPGFHLKKWIGPKEAQAEWHGGSPLQWLDQSRVWLADDRNYIAEGLLTKPNVVLINGIRPRLKDMVIVFKDDSLKKNFPDPRSLYGGFKFRAPIWQEGPLLYTKAADDLVGAFAITSLALELFKDRRRNRQRIQNFIGLMTRAEEVGFIGAIAHFDLGWMNRGKRQTICVSLETSRTLAGAEFGKGPVVRLGDRATVFDPGALQVLTQVAKKVLGKQYQRRVMDGGICEAGAAVAFGYPAIGISIPLGNYHNQSFEGGPDCRVPEGPGPEFVHKKDIEGMLKLCGGLLEKGLPWRNPWKGQRQAFVSRKQKARKWLETTKH